MRQPTSAARARRVPRPVLGAALLVLIAVAALNYQTLVNVLTGRFGVSLDLGAGGQAALRVPDGFTSSVWASGLSGPRFLVQGPDGAVYVAEQSNGRVSVLTDRDQDGRSDGRSTVAEGLNGPSSLAFLPDGTLLVGEHSQVSRLTLNADHAATARSVFIPDLPNVGVHQTKTVLLGPDGQVYVSVGSSCNACNESDERRAAVSVYAADGSGGRVFAKGLRNAVGLALNPWTQEIWATNNGRDMLGDDLPPETVYALQDGGDYGWPRCNAGTLVDPEFGGAGACTGVVAPVVQMQAHMAPLGLAFYQSGPFPAPYNNSLYVALHGSWNRTTKVGYKVMRVPLQNGQPAGPPEDFLTGFLGGSDTATGRPVGLLVTADGSLLVTDDKAGFIYRVAAK